MREYVEVLIPVPYPPRRKVVFVAATLAVKKRRAEEMDGRKLIFECMVKELVRRF